MTEQSTDYDSPWKEVIESFFPQFLEFFPDAYTVIHWTQRPEFLDAVNLAKVFSDNYDTLAMLTKYIQAAMRQATYKI